MNHKKNVLTLLALAISLILFAVSAQAYGNATMLTVTGAEFNTTTPALYVNCTDSRGLIQTFNISIYSTNSTVNNTHSQFLIANTTQVTNNTPTYVTLSAITAPAEVYYVLSCFNGTVAVGGDNNATISSIRFFGINQQPSISSVTSTDGFIARNNPVTFTTTWTDTNTSIITGTAVTATDATTIYVCSTNAFATDNSGCSGTQRCTSNLSGQETDGSTPCVYTVGLTETFGTKTAYAFVKDNNDYVSASTAVTYKVAGAGGYVTDPATGLLVPASVGGGTVATTSPPQNGGGSKTLIFVLVGIVAVVLFAAYVKNKK